MPSPDIAQALVTETGLMGPIVLAVDLANWVLDAIADVRKDKQRTPVTSRRACRSSTHEGRGFAGSTRLATIR